MDVRSRRVCTLSRPDAMQHNSFEAKERAFLEARNRVSDEELVARLNSTPDLGGALLVALSEFVSRRPPSATLHPREDGDGR